MPVLTVITHFIRLQWHVGLRYATARYFVLMASPYTTVDTWRTAKPCPDGWPLSTSTYLAAFSQLHKGSGRCNKTSNYSKIQYQYQKTCETSFAHRETFKWGPWPSLHPSHWNRTSSHKIRVSYVYGVRFVWLSIAILSLTDWLCIFAFYWNSPWRWQWQSHKRGKQNQIRNNVGLHSMQECNTTLSRSVLCMVIAHDLTMQW